MTEAHQYDRDCCRRFLCLFCLEFVELAFVVVVESAVNPGLASNPVGSQG